MQHICEKPVVKTIANDFMLPGGQNIIVAIMITDGYN
jgi:DNA-directed RNA polymerase beta subunit